MTSPAGQARWDGSLHCLFMMIWVHIERRYWGATCRGVKEKEEQGHEEDVKLPCMLRWCRVTVLDLSPLRIRDYGVG